MVRTANRDIRLCAALLVLAVGIVYLPSTRAGFIWDDDALVTQNAAVRTVDGLYSIWFTSWSGDYIPLTSSSFWLEWHLWKDNPIGYHLVNIVLHGANAVLLWRVLSRLRVKGAWLAALFFGLHPVCAASVTWVAERKNTLSMFFFLASLLFFLRDEEGAHRPADAGGAQAAPSAPTPWYWRSVGAFALALLAKSSVVVLPAVLLLCVWWQRSRITRKDFARLVPFVLLSLLFCVIAIGIQHKAVHTGAEAAQDPLSARLMGGSWALWFYLGKIVLPVNLTMIYPRWEINTGAVPSYAPAAIFAALMVGFWRNRLGWGRPFLFAFGYFLIALSPVLGLFNMAFFSNSQVADHFQYLAIPGILALCAAGISQLPRLARPPTALVPAALAIFLSTLTWQREMVLGNSQKLWTDNATKNTNSWRVYMNLNAALLEQGKTNEAIQAYNKATQLFPGRKK